VLSDNPMLQELRAGDFVVASGQLASAAAVRGGFSPQFEARQIVPQ
jgi:hypothetical protein